MPKREELWQHFIFWSPQLSFVCTCLCLPDKNEDICFRDILLLPDWNTDDYILKEPKV
jgi:hypothetical protein